VRNGPLRVRCPLVQRRKINWSFQSIFFHLFFACTHTSQLPNGHHPNVSQEVRDNKLQAQLQQRPATAEVMPASQPDDADHAKRTSGPSAVRPETAGEASLRPRSAWGSKDAGASSSVVAARSNISQVTRNRIAARAAAAGHNGGVTGGQLAAEASSSGRATTGALQPWKEASGVNGGVEGDKGGGNAGGLSLAVGLHSCCVQLTHGLKSPGFNP
jgi:hypothetical protein